MNILRQVRGMAAGLDEVDARILRTLQQNARTTNTEIARQLDMAPSAILERVRKLEARGLVQGYEARLDAKALGHGLVAFIHVKSQERHGDEDTGARLARLPEVQEVHVVAGEDCYLLKVRVRDVDALRALLHERINALPSVAGTRTTIVLGTLKETSRLPVEPDGERALRLVRR